jgi:SulP family sulfate permease
LYRNHFATEIFWGLFIPLFAVAVFKSYYKPAPEVKKLYVYRIGIFIANILPLIAMIIGAKCAYDIQSNNLTDYYARTLKTVGALNAGINDLIHVPVFDQPWGPLFIEIIPIALIAFMESYSVARKIALERRELHLLNCNQELFAVGIANLIGSVGSSYPVAGSFSRSSLNAAAGARTPLSKAVCMLVVVLVISTLTQTLEYVPTAANAAVIWAALWNLIDFTDLWDTFKINKQDWFVEISTLVITFVIDTETGLACGIGLSVIFLLYDLAFSSKSRPFSTKSSNGVEVVRINSDLSFFTVSRIKDYIAFEVLLNPSKNVKRLIIDFIDVKHVDKTALLAFEEIYLQAEGQEVVIETINVPADVSLKFEKAGISPGPPLMVYDFDVEKPTRSMSHDDSMSTSKHTIHVPVHP